jgi:hypothetical protein
LRRISNRKLVSFWLNTPSMTLGRCINAAAGLGGVRFQSFPIKTSDAETSKIKTGTPVTFRSPLELDLTGPVFNHTPCTHDGR